MICKQAVKYGSEYIGTGLWASAFSIYLARCKALNDGNRFR